jgi:hypothetical protein
LWNTRQGQPGTIVRPGTISAATSNATKRPAHGRIAVPDVRGQRLLDDLDRHARKLIPVDGGLLRAL